MRKAGPNTRLSDLNNPTMRLVEKIRIMRSIVKNY